MLPKDEFPWLNLAAGLPSDVRSRSELRNLSGQDATDRHREIIRTELVKAVADRLDRRPNEYTFGDEIVRAAHEMIVSAFRQAGSDATRLTIELGDPRLTKDVLERVARETGARLVYKEGAGKATFIKTDQAEGSSSS